MRLRYLTLFVPFVASFVAPMASGQSAAGPSEIEGYPASYPEDFEARHAMCLEAITIDANTAYEDALIWKGDGGGRRAQHCIALALYALGHKDEAASRIEEMGNDISLGTPQMRAEWLTEAADFWIAAGKSEEAIDAASAALELIEEHIGAYLARARAYANLEKWEFAQLDLEWVLLADPRHAAALRYRADARRNLGQLEEALVDIEAALRVEPSVESALVRGRIREQIRLAELKD